METGLSSIKARIAGLCLHAGGSSRCAYIAHAAVCFMMGQPLCLQNERMGVQQCTRSVILFWQYP